MPSDHESGGVFVIILPFESQALPALQLGSYFMVDMDKVMAAMNGPGDKSKISSVMAKAIKKAALAEAMKAKQAEIEKKPTAKVVALKKKPAPTIAKKVSKAPVKKAAATKKVERKTMKRPGSKKK
jgi:hypothetical protein